jgi:hypothetical protein
MVPEEAGFCRISPQHGSFHAATSLAKVIKSRRWHYGDPGTAQRGGERFLA